MPAGAVYVGRPTAWGNPYQIGDPIPRLAGITVDGALNAMATRNFGGAWAARQAARDSLWLAPLRGRDLACWCELCPAHADGLPLGATCPDCAPCHADVLLELANR